MYVEIICGIVGAALIPPFLYFLCTYIYHVFQLKKYPPGPFPVPVIGNLHLMGKKPYETFSRMGERYGAVFSISLGMTRVVIINKIGAAREALQKKDPKFAGRPQTSTLETLSRGYRNMVCIDQGPTWKFRRGMAHSALMGICGDGFGNLEKIVTKESKDLKLRLETKAGTPVDVKSEIGLLILNIICTVVFGRRFEHDDPEGKNIINFCHEIITSTSAGDPAAFLPWLRIFPSKNLQTFQNGIAKRDTYLRIVVTEHQNTFDPNNIRDYTDAVINLSRKERSDGDRSGAHPMTSDHIELLVSDVFFAGTETVQTVLRWIILYLLHWPTYQDEIYEEIISAVGEERYPNLNDSTLLHLTQAVIYETIRFSSSGPLGIPHKSIQSGDINGKPIPENTQILFNVWNFHHDEEFWKNPFEFNPYRWLDEDKKVVVNQESYLPFSAGARTCLGEPMARRELILIFSRLMRDFRIEPNPNEPFPSLEAIFGATLSPFPYSAIFKLRVSVQ